MAKIRCPVCDTPIILRHSRWKNTCGRWKCLIAYQKMERDARRKKDEPFVERYRCSLVLAIRLRNASAPALGVQAPETYRAIITPVNQRPIVPLPRKRRYRFVKRLIRLVEGAFPNPQANPRPPVENRQSLPILSAACANCEGKCCLRGGTGAYLHRDSIRRFAGNHPDIKANDIIDAYSRRLPLATYQNSCVFHASNGCRLPENLRSTTCLNTICGGVVELRNRIELDGESRFFLAAANKNRVVRGQFEER